MDKLLLAFGRRVLFSCPRQHRAIRVNGAGNRKQATATRVPNGSIRVDGRLDDEVWQKATPITDFIQKEPIEGAAPTDAMDVGSRMTTTCCMSARGCISKDGRIQAPLGRRDNIDQAEHILVSFDTFLDRRTAFVFGVTAAGVRIDRYHSSDQEDSFDSGFDPVWRAETSVGGRSVDRRAVDSVLAAALQPRTEQTWGLNLYRFRPTLDEADYWMMIPRTVRAWSSRFGDVSGINGVVPPRRIEALPYVAGGSTVDGDRDRGNPFDDGRNLEGRVGADVKMGLGPNLTLETALNPDFGQVEADPAEVNLTGVRDALPREAAVLRRRREAVQHRPPELLLLAPHRRAADRAGERRLRRVSRPDHDPRRRQADRAAAVEDLARLHRRRDRR